MSIEDKIGFAIMHGSTTDKIENLIKSSPSLVNGKFLNEPFILLAAQSGRIDVVRLLIEHGADVNAKGMGGFTALHVAAGKGYRDIVELLLLNGADVNAKTRDLSTPLHMAVEGGADVVETLLEHGADSHFRNKDGESPLDRAKALGKEDIATLLGKYQGHISTFQKTKKWWEFWK
jgi:ankyrin repeat protein